MTQQVAKPLGRAGAAVAMFALLFSALAFTSPVLATHQDGHEGCPAPTTLLVTFSWTGSGFTPNGGNSQGVSVSGDADQAFWTSSQVISALVISAGGVSYNIALDFPETVGSVSPHNYAVFGGASIDTLALCVGEKTRPDTTTSGPSVELSKTAECATLGQDGMATVMGTITVESDSRRPSRITTALDRILGPGDATLHTETIGDLIGVVLTSPRDSVTVNYAITFDPGDVESFDNFIEVTIEDANTGEDRMKIYNARAAFELCDVPDVPVEEEQGELTVIKFECEADAAGVAFFVNDEDAPVDECEPSAGEFTVNPGSIDLEVDETATVDLDPGTYTLTETSPNSGTSASFAVAAGEETVVTVINFFAEGEEAAPPPDEEEEEQPREDTKGGQLPDTALPMPGGTLPALMALAVIAALGTTAFATVEARRRR
jgi:hypothetical protein